MKLPKQPRTPKGVKYTLTVPQSVLFADLSLQGNRRAVFKRLGMDYEPAYVAIDAGGAMSWNYDNDRDLEDALLGRDGSATDAIDSFIKLMARTAKKLDEVSKDLSEKPIKDPASNIKAYWQAYEEHMTSLFTFWNVERLLSDTLTTELKKVGRQNEIDNGLVRYLRPDQPNYFVKERIALKKLTDKFKIEPNTTVKNAPKALITALEDHRDQYGFLLAPFNLDNPLSIDDLLQRAKETATEPTPAKEAPDNFTDLPPELKRLAVLARRFTFWKSERLDLFALADSRVKKLYQKAAASLSLASKDMFAMTSDELLQSLKSGKAVVGAGTLQERQKAYCLILSGGKIGFYEPSAADDKTTAGGDNVELSGVAASAGIVTGKVRLIKDLKDAKQFEKGEIIVTAMTRPEMGVALDRAAGFVTDEGGLLCHAAIISREMKKPCVIATGNATKLLKDGQLIEVDGTRGVVKILGD